MIQPAALDPLALPLHGRQVIEASAGTGKTWTLSALYLRLVLGLRDPIEPQAALGPPLMPPQILVMTFTEAATAELRERIRQRLGPGFWPTRARCRCIFDAIARPHPTPLACQLRATLRACRAVDGRSGHPHHPWLEPAHAARTRFRQPKLV